MCQLSDVDLRTLAEALVRPFNPERVQPASIDLTLGPEVRRPKELTKGAAVTLGVDDQADFTDTFVYPDGYSIPLLPGASILAHTAEQVTVPDRFCAYVMGKSSIARWHVQVEAAGLVDPGFPNAYVPGQPVKGGQLVLEITNNSPWVVCLRVGMPICQITFHRLSCPAERPYGTARGSHYSNQTGATPSAVWEKRK